MVASIEYIEQVIDTYGRATEANLRTPTRQGNVIVLTADDADEVMITGDLHGHRPNFNAIRRTADLDQNPRRHLIMQEVCHGGPSYPTNGGCMSHAMLEDVAKLKATHPDRLHFVLSNHELAELTDYPILKSQKMLNLFFRYGLQEMYGPATEKVRQAYLAFLRSSPLAVRLPGGVLFTHSLPEQLDQRPFDQSVFDRELEVADLREGGAVFDLLWGRDYRQENADGFAQLMGARTLIHGHDPCPDGYKVPNTTQIILDCCGRPAAYVIVPIDESVTHDAIVERIKTL
ncbi:MAG: metallophosphoesterase [Pirellulales bacterium]